MGLLCSKTPQVSMFNDQKYIYFLNGGNVFFFPFPVALACAPFCGFLYRLWWRRIFFSPAAKIHITGEI